jgi:hypothetical protein
MFALPYASGFCADRQIRSSTENVTLLVSLQLCKVIKMAEFSLSEPP